MKYFDCTPGESAAERGSPSLYLVTTDEILSVEHHNLVEIIYYGLRFKSKSGHLTHRV